MKILNIVSWVLIFTYYTCSYASPSYNLFQQHNSPDHHPILDNCFIPSSEYILNANWVAWEPYQFITLSPDAGGYKLTGMDIEIVKAVAAKTGIKLQYSRSSGQQAQNNIEKGTTGLIAGMSYSNARESYAYYSEPYRFEENSIFILKKNDWNLNFKNISELLAQIRLQNFRLGIGTGFIYADDQINDFIKDEANKDLIFRYNNESMAIQELLKGNIDGFIGDRVSTTAVILNKRAVHVINEFSLNIKTPIHMIFSKKIIALSVVNSFNHQIKEFLNSSEYKDIVKRYLYPILVIYTCHSEWFYIMSIIGTVCFAISGLAIGSKENLTFFGTLLIAIIPSLSGSIMRDIIITPNNSEIIFTPNYLYYTLIIVLVGFAAIRLLNYYNTASQEDYILQRFGDNLIIICDSLGQAAFITTGISIVIMHKIEPIELWGPFFAFVISHTGVILRDLMYKKSSIDSISNEINAEITILWSLIFSIFLSINAAAPNAVKIKIAVIIITIGCFLTKLAVQYTKIPNIRFRK